MRLTAIAAVSQNGGLGLEGRLLFRIPEDLRRFQSLTMGGTLIMGRKTLDSLPGGHPLPGRTHVVLSRHPERVRQGVRTVSGVRELEALLPTLPRPWVVAGGGEIYQLLLPLCHQVLLTVVGQEEKADCFFPELGKDWTLTQQSEWYEYKNTPYCFQQWERKAP